MTDFNTAPANGIDTAKRAYVGDLATGVGDREYADTPQGFLLPSIPGGISWVQMVADVVSNTWAAQKEEGPGKYFFEMVHHVPALIELGNVLTTNVEEIEIYNAYSVDAQSLTAAAANAGIGVDFQGLPALPATIDPQSSLTFDVVISTEGPPNIDGTLDFTLSIGSFSIAVTGSRVIMFAFEPEQPMEETLETKTDVITAANGDEQRISIRKHPRQSLQMMLRVPEGDSLRRLDSLLKGWHSRVFGVPIWWEGRMLSGDITTADTVINVDTRYGDFRAGSLAIVWADDETFDALEIASTTDSTITFTSPFTQDFTATETLVMPLRVANMDPVISRERYLKNLMDIKVRFRVLDNEADIADASTFPTHNSKVLLSEPNKVGGDTVQDDLFREIHIVDNGIAAPLQFSDWVTSHPITKKGFLGDSLKRVWEVRQLFHELRGSQVSFYLPTFYNDLVVTQNLASGAFLMDIENIGYDSYIQAEEPFRSVEIELNDGTLIHRQVLSSTVIDSDTERLTVDVAWDSLVDYTTIVRVSYCRLVRIADDKITLTHQRPGDAEINVNIIGVQQ